MIVAGGIVLGIIIVGFCIHRCRKMYILRRQRRKVETYFDVLLLFSDCASLIIAYSGYSKVLLFELLTAKSDTLIERAIRSRIVRKQDLLVAACCNGDVHVVMYLLTQKICIIDDLRNDNMRAIRKACKYNQIAVVKYLLDLHVFSIRDLQCKWTLKNNNGSKEICDCYLLNIALKHNYFKIARLLLATHAFNQ